MFNLYNSRNNSMLSKDNKNFQEEINNRKNEEEKSTSNIQQNNVCDKLENCQNKNCENFSCSQRTNGFFKQDNLDNTKKINTYSTTFEDLQKARQDLIGEIDAVIQYDNHAHATSDSIAKQLWLDIKTEELTHIGELLSLINQLDDSQKQYVEKGINEFNQKFLRN